MGGRELDSTGSTRDKEGFREYNNKLSGLIKCGNCLEYLRICYLLRKDSSS
jgi:hypothetical protein